MKTLLTGATGYLGGVVLERWLLEGARPVRCLVRPGSARGRLHALRARFGAKALEIMEGSLTRRSDAERAVAEVECVVHTAALTRGAPADMFLNSVVGTRHLVDAVARSGVQRFVHVSSLGVYGLSDIPPDRPITEETAVEAYPERRDVYSHTKIWQETLVARLAARPGLSTIVLRPGPLYGRGGSAFPSRIGLQIAGAMLQLGRDAALPLSYVDNCANAVRLAAFDTGFAAGAYNVVDSDLPTASEYLHRYRREVGAVRTLRIPFGATLLLARWIERYHHASRGQLPLVLTPYRVRSLLGGHSYDAARLRRRGWVQEIPTSEALTTAFRDLRSGSATDWTQMRIVS